MSERADLSEICSLIFVGVTFPRETGETPKLVVDLFSSGKNTFRKTNHGNRLGFRRKKLHQQRQTLDFVEDFACGIFKDFVFFPFFVVLPFLHLSFFSTIFSP